MLWKVLRGDAEGLNIRTGLQIAIIEPRLHRLVSCPPLRSNLTTYIRRLTMSTFLIGAFRPLYLFITHYRYRQISIVQHLCIGYR